MNKCSICGIEIESGFACIDCLRMHLETPTFDQLSPEHLKNLEDLYIKVYGKDKKTNSKDN